MRTVQLEPYLFFRGDCREAMAFYKSVFGGELTMQTVGEAPASDQAGNKDDIMHARLSGGLVAFMASDTPTASATAAKVELSLSGTDEKLLRKVFNTLAEGGKVRMPLEKQFWGALFGAVTDRFGVDWMVNIPVDHA